MTVSHVRMDNRLIHGQILVSWNSHLKIDHLIVTNDKVAQDPMQVTLLKAVTPIGAKVSVLSVADCVKYCQSPESEKENIFINLLGNSSGNIAECLSCFTPLKFQCP